MSGFYGTTANPPPHTGANHAPLLPASTRSVGWNAPDALYENGQILVKSSPQRRPARAPSNDAIGGNAEACQKRSYIASRTTEGLQFLCAGFLPTEAMVDREMGSE